MEGSRLFDTGPYRWNREARRVSKERRRDRLFCPDQSRTIGSFIPEDEIPEYDDDGEFDHEQLEPRDLYTERHKKLLHAAIRRALDDLAPCPPDTWPGWEEELELRRAYVFKKHVPGKKRCRLLHEINCDERRLQAAKDAYDWLTDLGPEPHPPMSYPWMAELLGFPLDIRPFLDRALQDVSHYMQLLSNQRHRTR